MLDTTNPYLSENPAKLSNDQLVTAWHAAKSTLAQATTIERHLRDMVTARLFPSPPEKGTARTPLGYGKEMKLTAKINYTVDREALGLAKANLPQDVLDSVIKYKPEVIEAGLAALDPRYKAAVAAFVTSKPGAPAIEIVDAKKK